jgi:hypothetical protein
MFNLMNDYIIHSMGPLAKLRFCNFDGVDSLRLNSAGHDIVANGEMDGADKNGGLQLPQWINL